MAGEACHVFSSTTLLGLTWVLGLMKSFLLLLILLVVSACQDHAAGQSADGSKALAPEATITQLAGWTTQQQTADPASFISMSQADRSVVSVTNDGPLRQIEIHGADSPEGVTVTTTLTGQLKEITIQSGSSVYTVQNSGGKLVLVESAQ